MVIAKSSMDRIRTWESRVDRAGREDHGFGDQGVLADHDPGDLQR